MTSDFSGLIDLQADMLCEAWDSAEIGAVAFNDARRYLAANAAYCTLTGYSREEMTDLRAGHNLMLGEMSQTELSQAEFIERITDRPSLDRAVIRRRDGNALPVAYLVVPSQLSELPCYIGLVWPQEMFRGS